MPIQYPVNTNPSTGFTEREVELINKSRLVMSKPFQKEFADDNQMLAFIDLVVQNINYYPPLSDYAVASIPRFFDTIVVLGVQMYSSLFYAQKWTINDFSYNDGGFTISYDRVSKLTAVQKIFFDIYDKNAATVKKNQMFSLLLGTPKMQNQLGIMIRLALR